MFPFRSFVEYNYLFSSFQFDKFRPQKLNLKLILLHTLNYTCDYASELQWRKFGGFFFN